MIKPGSGAVGNKVAHHKPAKAGGGAAGNKVAHHKAATTRTNTGARHHAAKHTRPANVQAHRGHAGGGAHRAAAHRGGGMRGGGGRGGGRRSDIMLKHDVVLLGRLDNGLGFYRFSYNGGTRPYVGVIAQEVQRVVPEAVMRGRDGYLRVNYDRLGLKFESYERWIEGGGKIPYR